MNINIYPRNVLYVLLGMIAVLICLNIGSIFLKFSVYQGHSTGLTRLFDFNTERNVPTLFSSVLLVIASALLAAIVFMQMRAGRSFIPWLGLSVIFLYLGIDEVATIHEGFTIDIRKSMEVSGFLYYAWVIPYAVLTLVLGLAYLKFLFSLPRKIMYLFMFSGALFVFGALGMEIIESGLHYYSGADNLLYAFYYTLEETLEMVGVTIFICSLLYYMATQYDPLTFTVTLSNETQLAKSRMTGYHFG